jgi:hypothetical protein
VNGTQQVWFMLIVLTHGAEAYVLHNIDAVLVISKDFFFSMALRPNQGHGLLILEVSRSHTTTCHSR